MKDHVEKRARTLVKEMDHEIRKVFPQYPGTQVVTSFSSRRSHSRGGLYIVKKPWIYAPKVSLSLLYYTYEATETFYEYNHISKHPIIGDVYGDTETRLRAIVSHEVAHAVTDWDHSARRRPYMLELSGEYKGCNDPFIEEVLRKNTPRYTAPHGIAWQSVYAMLREKFVNHLLTKKAA